MSEAVLLRINWKTLWVDLAVEVMAFQGAAAEVKARAMKDLAERLWPGYTYVVVSNPAPATTEVEGPKSDERGGPDG